MFNSSLEYAQKLDAEDSLSHLKNEFIFPKHNDHPVLYFSGNSLGLQPKCTSEFLLKELSNWSNYGVEGHFKGENPWLSYHKHVSRKSCALLGSLEHETIIMNSLSVNLHILLTSFYQPIGNKTKIIIEENAFPSDIYAVKSHLQNNKYDNSHLIEIKTDQNLCISTENILKTIEINKNETALVLLSGVQYLSGQFFELEKISSYCREHKIIIGLDLAHAVGNVPLSLHNWGVDFAVWCTYKYLNSGPGAVGGAFIHEKHHANTSLKRLNGWWSNKEENRFRMSSEIDLAPTAESWQISNAPVVSMASYAASLSVFEKTSIEKLRAKSILLTQYLEFFLLEINTTYGEVLSILTPKNPSERGAQLSIVLHKADKSMIEKLSEEGVIVDWRYLPDGKGLIRIAPTPLYTSFTDVWNFIQLFTKIVCHK